jgi:hypothetical protein
MKSITHARWNFGSTLTLVLVTLLSHESLQAGPPAPPASATPRSSVVTAGPRPGTASPLPMHDLVKSSETANQRTAALPGAQSIDYGVFQFGGRVYSTGTEDVIVRVLDAISVRPVAPGHNKPSLCPISQGVYLLTPGNDRFLGSNQQVGRTVNLGKLPPGELIFGLRVDEYGCYFQTGDASRNPDKLDHVSMRTFKYGGYVELWFEDAIGPKGTGRSDRNFNDLVLSVSGGIDNGAMADFVNTVEQLPAETREATIAALKKVDPKRAAVFAMPRNKSPAVADRP